MKGKKKKQAGSTTDERERRVRGIVKARVSAGYDTVSSNSWTSAKFIC